MCKNNKVKIRDRCEPVRCPNPGIVDRIPVPGLSAYELYKLYYPDSPLTEKEYADLNIDILYYDTVLDFPEEGLPNKLYIDKSVPSSYIWEDGVYKSVSGEWGSITGDIQNQTDLIEYIDEALDVITKGIPFWEQPTIGDGYDIDDKVLHEVGGTTYIFVSTVDDNELEPSIPEIPEWLLVGVEDSDIVRYSRRVDTDSTLKGGGDLSQDRALGIADNVVPATATLYSGNINLLTTTGYWFANPAVVTIANGYPIDSTGARGACIEIFKTSYSDNALIQRVTISGNQIHTMGHKRFFERTMAGGIWGNSWIELAQDHTVVHRTGDLAETITGQKTFANRVQLRAGTTTEPPLIIPQGVLTTVPQAGSIESTADGLYYTNGASERNGLEEKPTVKTVTSTTYTAVASDYNKWLILNNANLIQMTVPSGVFKAGQSIKGRQGGLGQVEFIAGSGMTLLKADTDNLATAEQNAVFEIFFESPTQAIVYGRLESSL